MRIIKMVGISILFHLVIFGSVFMLRPKVIPLLPFINQGKEDQYIILTSLPKKVLPENSKKDRMIKKKNISLSKSKRKKRKKMVKKAVSRTKQQQNRTIQILNEKKSGVKKLTWSWHTPSPSYPDIARQKGWEGKVLLEVQSDKNGHMSIVKVKKSSGYKILDEEAIKTVRSWRVSANLKKGIIPIHYRLRDY